jgi:hypothetical protein
MQRDFVQANVCVPPAANQSENRQLPVPHTRGGGAPSFTEIMAMSDEQLRKCQIPEDQINKIRQARAQNQHKFASHLPIQVTQPRPPPTTGAPGWVGPTSAMEEGIQLFGPEMPGNVPVHSALTGIPITKINEASAAIATIRPECVPQAKTCWSCLFTYSSIYFFTSNC